MRKLKIMEHISLDGVIRQHLHCLRNGRSFEGSYRDRREISEYVTAVFESVYLVT